MPLIKYLFKRFRNVSFPTLLSRDFFLVKLPLCFVYYSYRVAVWQNKRTLCTVLKALLGQPSEPKASWLPEFPFDVKKKHSNVKSQISSMIKDYSLQFQNFLQTSLSSKYIQSWNSLEKFSNFKRSAVPSSMYLVLFFFSSLLLGRCDNQLFRNPAKFGPQIYTVLCNIWFWFGAKPCRISAVHTCTIDRNLTHDATFRWALS